MNIKKLIFILLGGIAGLFIVAIAYVTLVINPNDYKSEIIDQVNENTGRSLVIDGDISWRFLPNIGVSLGHAQIDNPAGFPDEPTMQFESAQVDLALIPLLSKKIQIGLVSISGLSINLHTREDGVNNFEVAEQPEVITKSENKQTKSDSSVKINELVIEGFEVIDAQIVIENLAQKTKQSVEAINFTMGKLQLDEIVPIVFSAAVSVVQESGDVKAFIQSKGGLKLSNKYQRIDFIDLTTNIAANGEALPKKEIEINHQISGYFDSAKQMLSLDKMTLSLLGIDVEGKLSAKLAGIPDIEFEITTGDIDLDAIPPKAESEAVVEDEQQQAIDLSWMKDFNVKGLATINSVKASNLTISNISFPMELKNAQLKLSAVKAQLYQGDILSNMLLDGRKSIPGFSMDTKISNVQALPMVKDLLEKEIISGAMNMSVNIKGKGLDDKSIRKNTKGSGQFAFTDGAIHGVNVADLIRTTYAKVKGKTIESSDEPVQTDFASFTGSFSLADGLAKNTDLKLLSPLLRIAGSGQANIIKETLNYKLKTSIVGTLKGQGGEELTDLKSVSIPLKIKGPMADPKISLDMGDLFKSKTKKKLKDKLKGLLN